MKKFLFILMAFVATTFSALAATVTVTFNNGQNMEGQLVNLTDTTLVLRAYYAATGDKEITILPERVKYFHISGIGRYNVEEGEELLIEGGVENKDHLSVELYPEYEGVGMIYKKGDMVVVHPRRKGEWELHYIDYCTDYAIDSDVDCTELGYQTAPFVLIRTKDLCFTTRNYGGQSIPMYANPDETSRVVGEINKAEISLHPYDYDSTNEMVLVKYKGKWGWISTEWVCSNPFTTCC